MEQMTDQDFFTILGIDRNYPFDDDKDLKKKYRKMAAKLHPDKNLGNPKAKENFQRLKEAYDVLSDPQKRIIYKKYGEGGLKRHEQMGDQKAKPKVVKLKVKLRECFTGFSRDLDIKTKAQCQECYGAGGKGKMSSCKKCDAQGVVKVEKEIMHPILGMPCHAIVREECKACSGRGKVFEEKCNCSDGFTERITSVSVEVSPGTLQYVNELPEKGDDDENGKRGLLVIVLDIDTEGFRVHGEYGHLLLEKEISSVEAFTGVDYNVDLPNGKTIRIKEGGKGTVITPDSIHIVEDEGMPIEGTDLFGDLIVQYSIKWDKNLTSEQITSLNNVKKGGKKRKPRKSDSKILFTRKDLRRVFHHNKERKSDRDLDSDDSDDDNMDGQGVFINGQRVKMGVGGDGNLPPGMAQMFSGLFG